MSEGPITEPVAVANGSPDGQATDTRTGNNNNGGNNNSGGGNGSGGTPEPAQKRGMSKGTRIALLVILVIAVLAGGGVTAWYFIDAQNYVSTDNAQIDGDKIAVNAPTSGTVIDWRATQGSELRQDQVVGRIRIQGAFVQPE